jgi:hypothetical protein
MDGELAPGAFEAWCADHGNSIRIRTKPITAMSASNWGAYAQVVRASCVRCDTLEKAVFEFGRLYEAPAGTTSTHLPGFAGRLDYAKQRSPPSMCRLRSRVRCATG